MINITLEDEPVSCEPGTTLYELSRQYQKNYEFPIIVAKCNGIIQELYHEVVDGTHVEFCTAGDADGFRVYIRGMSMLLLKAVYKEVPADEMEGVSIEFCLDSGYFCRIEGDVAMTQELLGRIEKRMRKYVDKDILFEKHVIRTRDAKQLFDSLNMCDKGQLMEYRKNSRMTVYNLGKFTDYFYGAMPYSTSILRNFRLELFEDGFVFVVPRQENPVEMPEFKPGMKQYRTLQYTNEWGRKLNVATVGQLNHQIVRGDFQDLMLTQEALGIAVLKGLLRIWILGLLLGINILGRLLCIWILRRQRRDLVTAIVAKCRIIRQKLSTVRTSQHWLHILSGSLNLSYNYYNTKSMLCQFLRKLCLCCCFFSTRMSVPRNCRQV